jgi:hypothetical protein
VIQKLEILLSEKLERIKNLEATNANMTSASERRGDNIESDMHQLLLENGQLKMRVAEMERRTAMTPMTAAFDPSDLRRSLDDFERELDLERQDLLKQIHSPASIPLTTPLGKEIEDFKYLLRAERAEAKVKALELELEQSAKEFAKKLAVAVGKK